MDDRAPIDYARRHDDVHDGNWFGCALAFGLSGLIIGMFFGMLLMAWWL